MDTIRALSVPQFSPTFSARVQGGFAAPSSPGGLNYVSLLGQILQAFSQLGQGWSGYANGAGALAPGPFGSGARPAGFTGYGTSQGSAGALVSGPFGSGARPAGFTGYGAMPSGPSGLQTGGMPGPTDSGEFASYLQAQRLGGSLEGKTGIAQNDAIAGTRFGQEPDPTLWHAAVARNYAAQFAAYAIGADPLSAQGLQAGQNAFPTMSPDAQLFMQVASVFKGNLFNGPGNYDNPGLGRLLQGTGNADLINNPQVGQTDVQTIGAITQALNRGTLTLNQVINSGTIDNLDRYSTIINYVQSGGFAGDVSRYESRPF